MDGGVLVHSGPIGASLAPGGDEHGLGDGGHPLCSCRHTDPDGPTDWVAIHREVFVDTFIELLTELEAAYSEEMAQAPKPHLQKLRVELAASLQTMQAVLNLTGLRMAETLSSR
jgi:hypothetical protein